MNANNTKWDLLENISLLLYYLSVYGRRSYNEEKIVVL